MNEWPIKTVGMSEMISMPDNPRTILDDALAGLEASMERFGYVEPIVWTETTGHIVGGHQRYEILKGKGVREATVVIVRMTEDEECAVNLTLNNPKMEGTWDDPIASLLDSLQRDDESLFSVLRMDKLKSALDRNVKVGNDDPQGIDIGDDAPKYDTECPCCGHQWDIESKDIAVE